MSEPTPLAEQPVAGVAVPWAVVPGWRERFGVLAGITERGDEAAPFDLGLAGTAPIGAVLERWQRIQALAPGIAGVVVARQVHGVSVLWHPDSRPGWTVFQGADGHATSAPGLLLTVSLADCIPIYLVDPVKRGVALLHSGWRGTAGEILRAGVECLQRECGSRVSDIRAHVGVGICGDCYEVGAEVASACGRPPVDGGTTRLDLRGVISDQAAGLGLAEVSVSPLCSAHDAGRFMSHRRSGGRDGRMIAMLGILP
ncbi:MAG: polyphenol oxidase family protein [Gemmatimonadales bacterium]